MKMKKIILASKSPRRKELLQKCGVAFDIFAADIDETIDVNGDLCEEIKELSYKKADAVMKVYPDSVVIGSDTIVAVDNTVLGKPMDRDEAKQMIRMLSGRTHQVITGVCILSCKHCFNEVSVSNVTFGPVTEEEIEEYVLTGEADDKAGAYGIQGTAARFITHISGDYYSIMGFPVSMIYKELKNLEKY